MEKKPFYYHLEGKDSPRNKLVEEAFQRTYENDLIAFFSLFHFSFFQVMRVFPNFSQIS